MKCEDRTKRAATYVLVSVHAGEVQRRVAIVVLSLRVGLVVQQQQLDNRNKGRTSFVVMFASSGAFIRLYSNDKFVWLRSDSCG